MLVYFLWSHKFLFLAIVTQLLIFSPFSMTLSGGKLFVTLRPLFLFSLRQQLIIFQPFEVLPSPLIIGGDNFTGCSSASDWPVLVTWPRYWPLIGWGQSSQGAGFGTPRHWSWVIIVIIIVGGGGCWFCGHTMGPINTNNQTHLGHWDTTPFYYKSQPVQKILR